MFILVKEYCPFRVVTWGGLALGDVFRACGPALHVLSSSPEGGSGEELTRHLLDPGWGLSQDMLTGKNRTTVHPGGWRGFYMEGCGPDLSSFRMNV